MKRQKRLKIGQRAWYLCTHDGFAPPHSVRVTGITMRKGLSYEIVFDDARDDDGASWVQPDMICGTHRQALAHRRKTRGF